MTPLEKLIARLEELHTALISQTGLHEFGVAQREFTDFTRNAMPKIVEMLEVARRNLRVIKAGENEARSVDSDIATHTLNELNRLASEIVEDDQKRRDISRGDFLAVLIANWESVMKR